MILLEMCETFMNMNFNYGFFRLFFSMAIIFNVGPVAAIPAGFESLMETRSEIVEVQFGGQFVGFYPIEINEHTFKFVDPVSLFVEISPFVSSEFHESLKQRLNQIFPVLTDRTCILKPEICNIKEQYLLATYTHDSLVVSINADSSWLLNDDTKDTYRVADSRQRRAWLQSFNLSTQTGFDKSTQIGLRSSSIVGLSDSAHVSIDSSFRNAQGITQSQIDSAYIRNDFDNRWYGKVGKLSSYSVNRVTEGAFNYRLVPSLTVEGVQFGTGMHYYQPLNRSKDRYDLELFSATGGKADFYLSGVLAYSQALVPGYNKINRSELPYGNYDVEVKIFEGGQLARTEFYSLQTQGRPSDGKTQWLFRVGKIDGTEYSVAHISAWMPLYDSVLESISGTSLITSDYWVSELGFSSSGLASLYDDLFYRWSVDTQFLYGQELGNTIHGWSVSNNLNISNLSINLEKRKVDQDYCGYKSLYTCLDQTRLSLGTNILGNSVRFGYDIVNRHYGGISNNENMSYRKSISLGRNFVFQRVTTNLNVNLSQSSSPTFNHDNSLFVSLSLSARDDNDYFYSSLAYADGDYSLSAGLNKNLEDNNDMNFRIEHHDDGKINLSGNVKMDFNDLGAISSSAYISRDQAETNESVYLGYSVGFTFDEDGRFTTGRASINENSSAIVIENESGQSLPHSVAGLGVEIDSEARLGKVMYPVSGYTETSYRISESKKYKDEGFDSLVSGTGKRQVFLTPGNVLVHKLKSDTTFFYVGMIEGYDLINIDSSSNRIESFEIDSSGNFLIQAKEKIQSIKFLDLKGYVECKFENVAVSNSIYTINTVNCVRGQLN